MDGNGRWAQRRGQKRTDGHSAGEAALFDTVEGGLDIGLRWMTVYAFSTENWRRSPAEVRFLMQFNREVIRRRRDEMHDLGVRVVWVGREPKLWKSVVEELRAAEQLTRRNTRMTLAMCVNYGGRAEVADAVARIAQEAAEGRLDPAKVTERTLASHMYQPGMPDVDLFIRTSGEQRASNFLLWQSAYAEMEFSDVLWPDFDRRNLWQAVQEYASRERRFGKA